MPVGSIFPNSLLILSLLLGSSVKDHLYSRVDLGSHFRIFALDSINYFGKLCLPSLVFSQDDQLTTSFLTMLSRLPLFPLYYNGRTKFAPIHCSDLTDTIYHVISNNIYSKIIECVGPEIISFKELLQRLLRLIDKKRILVPCPLPLAQLSAKFFEILPKPIITRDQLRLLKYDNIPSGKYKTNSDIGMPSKRYFNDEVKKYCYMWREGGQFSTEKYTSNNDLENKTSQN